MKLARNTIVLVADGLQMMVLSIVDAANSRSLAVLNQRVIEDLPNRNILTDTPGASFARAGKGRNTYDKTNPHKENEDQFAAEAADLVVRIGKEEKRGITAVAASATLGILGKHYDSALQRRLIYDVAKDLTKHPVDETAQPLISYRLHCLTWLHGCSGSGRKQMTQALIIEGNMLIGCEVSKRLAELGFDSLDHAWTEEDALVMARRHPADLIVVGDDIQSGDGVKAARKICETREVPILLVTCDSFRKSQRLGEGAVLDGPFCFNKMAEAVNAAMQHTANSVTRNIYAERSDLRA